MLLITQDGESFEVIDANDRIWTVITDGKARTVVHNQSEATGRAHWNNNTLVETWQVDDRLDLTRCYSLAEDCENLIVKVTIAAGTLDQRATARLVYHQP